ncbi:hypothetical protein [Acinetobacter sp. 10FS3-1]|uniref:hypothetical protein n=1 Tax=Acinetobacter sp. 10FS3-1 TaxID=2563897 RepID=UPI00157DC471|nr:hypothetical protein [Acinetobacter sp. 10FS3-1]QKQ71176.1 hypothetical protein E5Y90_13600 [Acinetobacter sp. 10FS3-1]
MILIKKNDLKNYIFILFIIFLGLNPYNSEIILFGFPVYIKEFSLILFFIFSIVFFNFNKIFLVNKYLFLFILLYFYAFFTIFFHDYNNIIFVIYPLLVSVVIILIAYIYSDIADYEKFFYYLSWFLTFIFLLYAIYFPFGDSGYNRLKGPLGNAATIHVSILLVISVFVSEIMYGNRVKVLSGIGLFINIFLIILTGSKAALLCLVLFLMLLMMRNFSFKKMIVTVFLGFLGFVAYSLFFLKDRIVLEDFARTSNLETSLAILFSKTSNIIFGTGYGSVWPWYIYETSFSPNDLYGVYLVHSEGITLFHPHSVLLWSFVELGAIGLLIVLYLLISPFFKYFKFEGYKWVLLCGLLSTIPSFLFDSFLMKNWTISIFWMLFYFFLMSKKYQTK